MIHAAIFMILAAALGFGVGHLTYAEANLKLAAIKAKLNELEGNVITDAKVVIAEIRKHL